MCEHVRLRQGLAHLRLDLFAEVVSPLHRPVPGNENVHGHEASRAGAPRPNGMKEDPLFLERGERPGQFAALVLGQRRIEQTEPRFADELPSRPDDVDRHGDGDQRIQPQPSGRGDRRDADDDAGGGPDVRQEVPAVGAQRDRSKPLAGATERDRHGAVDRRRRGGDGDAEPRGRDGLRILPAPDRLDHDSDGGDEDQESLRTAREVLGLRVSECVTLVGGLCGDGQGPQRDQGGRQVDDGLGGVGEQADRARQPPGRELQSDRDHGGGDRKPRVEPRRRSLGHGRIL